MSGRVRIVKASMFQLDFGETFDVIWSEGAIYIMGFEAGLRAWRRLLQPSGYAAVTELSWIRQEPPVEAVEYWRGEYAGMATVEENRPRLRGAGYHEIGHFVLPEDAWWEPYYQPMQERVSVLREKYRSDLEAQRCLDGVDMEIEMYRKYSAWYGYVFYVMQS